MTMIAITHRTPEQYLTAADQEFAAGNYDNGSELLYQSVVCALSQLAADYGRPCKTPVELHNFASWLDEKHAGNGRHARNFRTAETFHHNAKYHFMPPDELVLGRPLVQEFVAALLSYQQKGAAR